MLSTKITQLFGIEHPILQCPVGKATGPALVAAVSNAGGLGFLPAASFEDASGLGKAIDRVRELTDKPFGVGFGFFVGEKNMDPEALFEVLRARGVAIAELSALASYLYTDTLKSMGAKVVHTCRSVKDARGSAKAGADAVILEGIEGQGLRSDLDVGSAVLIPAARDGLRIPLVASGGFADGRGLAAALCLGADGIAMKTRFVMTRESEADPSVKGYLMQALEGDTVIVAESATRGLRVLKTPVSEKYYLQNRRGEKLSGLHLEEDPLLSGDLSQGLLHLGQSIGLIRDIPTSEEVVSGAVSEAKEILGRVDSLFQQ